MTGRSSGEARAMPEGKWIAGTASAAGGSRKFKLWTPANTGSGRAWPLVMLLHGCTHDAEHMAEISGMNEVAAANGFLVVYPEQSAVANLLKCWNWFHPNHQAREAGEPSILAAVVDQVRATHNIDPDRVYLAGVSAGGAMASISCRDLSRSFRGCSRVCGSRIQGRDEHFRWIRCDETRRPRSDPARAACL